MAAVENPPPDPEPADPPRDGPAILIAPGRNDPAIVGDVLAAIEAADGLDYVREHQSDHQRVKRVVRE